jgi:hypothetical protein
VVVTKLIASLIPVLLLGFWLGARDQPIELNQVQFIALGAGLAAFGGYLVRQFTKFKNRKIVHEGAVGEPVLPQPRQRRGRVPPPAGCGRGGRGQGSGTCLPLPAHGRALTVCRGPDRRIEEWFAHRWEAAFDFEVDDGVGKLRRLRLIDDDGEGRLTAVPLDEAKCRLDQIWDGLFAYHAPPRSAEA